MAAFGLVVEIQKDFRCSFGVLKRTIEVFHEAALTSQIGMKEPYYRWNSFLEA